MMHAVFCTHVEGVCIVILFEGGTSTTANEEEVTLVEPSVMTTVYPAPAVKLVVLPLLMV
jgi:hypothetical protein